MASQWQVGQSQWLKRSRESQSVPWPMPRRQLPYRHESHHVNRHHRRFQDSPKGKISRIGLPSCRHGVDGAHHEARNCTPILQARGSGAWHSAIRQATQQPRHEARDRGHATQGAITRRSRSQHRLPHAGSSARYARRDHEEILAEPPGISRTHHEARDCRHAGHGRDRGGVSSTPGRVDLRGRWRSFRVLRLAHDDWKSLHTTALPSQA